MNLVPCTIQAGQIDLGTGASLPLPSALQGKSATQLVFGIRPENIALSASHDSMSLDAKVVITEPLGAETLVTFQIGGSEMVARCPASFSSKAGEAMQVHLAQEHMHLFDATTGGHL
jgi:multiple sugar transport system ATP-binding protein